MTPRRCTLLACPMLLLAPLLAGGCGVETTVVTAPAAISPEVDRLADWLSGSFDSSEQAARDPDFLDISLHSCRVWPSRSDGRWVYVEQARSDAPDRPYRQRMYRVRFDADGRLISEVFAFPEGMRPSAGSWRDPTTLDRIVPDLLLPREGCTVHLAWTNDRFVGGTEGEGCESTLAGAAYATSEVVIDADRITSWDRGFAADGSQVWGSEAGAYEFIRR